MRRKRLNHYVHAIAQMCVNRRLWPDLATLADLPDGHIEINILSGSVQHNLAGTLQLNIPEVTRNWLRQQCDKDNIPYEEITKASLSLVVGTNGVPTDKRFIICFDFTSRCEIQTDEMLYSRQSGNPTYWYKRPDL